MIRWHIKFDICIEEYMLGVNLCIYPNFRGDRVNDVEVDVR